MRARSITKDSPITVDSLISLKDAAFLTGLHERTVSAYTSAGTFPSVKIGHARHFVRSEVETWIAERNRRRAHTDQATTAVPPQPERCS